MGVTDDATYYGPAYAETTTTRERRSFLSMGEACYHIYLDDLYYTGHDRFLLCNDFQKDDKRLDTIHSHDKFFEFSGR